MATDPPVEDGAGQLPFSGKLVRLPNDQLREREYLRPDEMDRLIAAGGKSPRYGQRDKTLLLIMYRHGLRVSEAIRLSWQDVDFRSAHLLVRRLKGGKSGNHPLYGDELRSLRILKKDYPDSAYIFTSERQAPLSDHAIRKIVKRAGEIAELPFPIHPHMIRHSTGFYLAARGIDIRVIQDYLGHSNIHHTVRYTQLAPGRFTGLW